MVQKPKYAHKTNIMRELRDNYILPMPPANERIQCFEWAEAADERIHDGILQAYRSQNVEMDLDLPGVRDVVRWQNITVVSI